MRSRDKQRGAKEGVSLGVVLLLVLANLLFTEASIAAGSGAALLASGCTGCHGYDGLSAGPATPNIAHMNAGTFVQRMKDFKSGNRVATIMGRLAKGYSDDELAVLGEYFSKRQLGHVVQPLDVALANKGRALAQKYCASCHINDGKVDDGGPGILAGQWLTYLCYTIEDYQSGLVHVPKKMREGLDAIKNEAGKEGITSVLHFYASQE